MHLEHKNSILEKSQNSIFTFFIKKRKIAYLMAVWILLMWAAASALIPKESVPKIDFWVATISTFYNWANAADMDSLITQKIENEIEDIDWIKKISSTSKNSMSIMTIEFDPWVDMNEKMNDLRSKIDNVKKDLPDDAEDPEITKIDSSLTPIFTLHLSWEVHPALLKDYAEDLSDALKKNPLISKADVVWDWERSFFVDLDPLKLKQYWITSLDVVNTIKSANKDYPIWYFNIWWLDYNLRINWKYQNTKDIKNTVVKSFSSDKWSSVIYISDLWKVYEWLDEPENIQKLYIKSNENIDDGNLKYLENKRLNSIKILVKKADSVNIFDVDGVAREIVSKFAKENFNWEVRVDYVSEMIVDVTKSYENVFINWAESIIIVIFLMILFIWAKEWMITWIIIPLSFLATIWTLYAMWSSLSFMTNFAMILSLWIIVDTAIVIVEWIHDWIKKWFTAEESAIIAVHEFKNPLISGLLTTLSVFIPLLVLPWVMWKYLSYIPITVSIVLIASVFISFFVIPAIAVTILEKKYNNWDDNTTLRHSQKDNILTKLNKFIEKKFLEAWKKYRIFLEKFLEKKFFRNFILSWVVVLFAFSMTLPVKFTMFPSDDVNYFTVVVKDEPWKTAEFANETSKKIEKYISTFPEVRYLESSVQWNQSSILVQLLTKEEREDLWLRTSIQLVAIFQKEFKKYKNQIVSVEEKKKWPPWVSPVSFRLIMDDIKNINQAIAIVEKMKNILKNIEWTSWVKDDFNESPWEIRYVIDRSAALRLWVSPDVIWSIVRSAVEDIEASIITKKWEDLSILVRYDKSKISSFDDIWYIQIPNRYWETVSLSQVVKQKISSNLMNVKRVDWNIAITVSSNLAEWWNAQEITWKFLEKIKTEDLWWDKIWVLPNWFSIINAWENAENADLFVAMLLWLISAIFLMFVILVVQFDSFSQPLIILFTIIMAQTWVNFWLFLTDTLRSMAFLIWSISLAWIVVNDAIILVDRINNLLEHNPKLKLSEIIAEAWESRLQPIILTTMTTIAWIFPLIFVDSFWRGLAVTIICGLLTASFLTLIATPIMMYLLERKKRR